MSKNPGTRSTKTVEDDRKKIVIVDDHPILRDGIAQLVSGQDDLVVSGQMGDAAEAMAEIPKLKPDLAIIDIFLEGSNGIELTKSLHSRYPVLKILILSMHDEAMYAERALRAGASGYVMKQEASRTILTAIRTVLNGDRYVSSRVSSLLVDQLIGGGKKDEEKISAERLSDRELEIFELFGRGLSRTAIAKKLHLSVKTVESHRANIKTKLNLQDSTDLMHKAMLWLEKGAEQ